MNKKQIVELIESDQPTPEEKSMQMVCLPILNVAISKIFNERMANNLNIKLEITTDVEDGFGADVQVFTEPSDVWSYGLLLLTERLRPQVSEVDKKLNWQLMQSLFNCFAINLIVIRLKIEGKLEERDGREYWLGEDVTDVELDDLPYMKIVKEELEEKFEFFMYWVQENFSELFQ